MMISAIAALDSRRGIGKDQNGENNNLLFHIPADFIRMKQLTTGHPIIMGRKTFESIGRVLPNRLNIVITHNVTKNDPSHTNLVFVSSLKEAIQLGEQTEHQRVIASKAKQSREIHNTKYIIQNTDPEVFILGGGQIFAEALPKVDRLYLTLVDHDFHGDTFFPDYSAFTKVVEKVRHTDWEVPYTFLTLER